MPRTRSPYSAEFRRQMVDLVRAGRNPDDLAREFEPSGHSIRAWVAQADRREGRREEAAPGLTAFERDELTISHQWLLDHVPMDKTRGLELSPEKTAITHVTEGFDFLGQNVRCYPCGKLLIKPARKSIRSLLTRVKEIGGRRLPPAPDPRRGCGWRRGHGILAPRRVPPPRARSGRSR
jgi:transposase-like protein